MTQVDSITDRHYLTTKTYASGAAGLDIRIETHQRYTRPQVDFAPWVLDQIPWRGDETVLDIGCGSGLYVDPILARLDRGGRLLSADVSLGMLRQIGARSPAPPIALLSADASNLPLPAGSCDVVLANHILYHLPDIGRGIAEIHRVLPPGGMLLAATNARDSMRQFLLEMEAAATALGVRLELPVSPVQLRFNLENGVDLICQTFADAELRLLDSELVFPSADPALAYVASLRDAYEPALPAGLSWEALLDQVGLQMAEVVIREGSYHVPKRTGVLIAKKRRPDGERMDP
jgi:SAM-dependent methyltransferase